jgi:hypothetical protein
MASFVCFTTGILGLAVEGLTADFGITVCAELCCECVGNNGSRTVPVAARGRLHAACCLARLKLQAACHAGRTCSAALHLKLWYVAHGFQLPSMFVSRIVGQQCAC